MSSEGKTTDKAVTEPQTAEAKGTGSVKVIEKQSQRRIFKIIVIGDSNVGKTCLTYRFCSGKFPDKTEATIGVDFREKQVNIDKEQVKVEPVKIYIRDMAFRPNVNIMTRRLFLELSNISFSEIKI